MQVIKEQINKEFLVIKRQGYLRANKRKTLAELNKKIADMCNQRVFNRSFMCFALNG